MRNVFCLCLLLIAPLAQAQSQGETCDLSRSNVGLAVARAASEWVHQNLLQPSIETAIEGVEADQSTIRVVSQVTSHDRIRITPTFSAYDNASYELRLTTLDGIPEPMNLVLINLGEVRAGRDSVDPSNQRRCRIRIINPNAPGSMMLILADRNAARRRFIGTTVNFHYGDFIAYVNP